MIKKTFANWNLFFDVNTKVTEYNLMRALEAWAHTQFTHNNSKEFNDALRKFIDSIRTLRRFY